MARDRGVNIEYRPGDTSGTDPATAANTFVKPWGSRLRALEAAVEAGHKVAFVQFGETLDDAITRERAAKESPRVRTVQTLAGAKTEQPVPDDRPKA